MKNCIETVLNEIKRAVSTIDVSATDKLLGIIGSTKRVYIAGMGRSGLVTKAFGQRLMQIGYEVHLADEITAPAITERDTLIASSGTGKTQLTLYMAKKAFSIGAKVVAITANENSGLARYADLVITIPVPLEQKRKRLLISTTQPARSLFEQAMFVYLESCILALVSKLKVSHKKLDRRHLNLE